MTLKHVRNGSVWLGGWLMGLSMAVAQTPPVCPVQPDPSCEGLKPPDAMVRIFGSDPESCNSDDDSSSSSGSKCQFKVQVVPANKDMPRCWAFLTYGGLEVKKAKKGRTIRWTIDPAVADHEFDAAEGIKLKAIAGSASSPGKTWKKHPLSTLQIFRLELKDPKRAKFCHYPQVRDKKANQLCCPADPVIANEP